MEKIAIIAFASFCVYCGYRFAKHTEQMQINTVKEVYQAQVDSLQAKYDQLVELNREHIDKCRFNYYNK